MILTVSQVPFQDGHVHAGMLSGAEWLNQVVTPQIKQYLDVYREYKVQLGLGLGLRFGLGLGLGLGLRLG